MFIYHHNSWILNISRGWREHGTNHCIQTPQILFANYLQTQPHQRAPKADNSMNTALPISGTPLLSGLEGGSIQNRLWWPNLFLCYISMKLLTAHHCQWNIEEDCPLYARDELLTLTLYAFQKNCAANTGHLLLHTYTVMKPTAGEKKKKHQKNPPVIAVSLIVSVVIFIVCTPRMQAALFKTEITAEQKMVSLYQA